MPVSTTDRSISLLLKYKRWKFPANLSKGGEPSIGVGLSGKRSGRRIRLTSLIVWFRVVCAAIKKITSSFIRRYGPRYVCDFYWPQRGNFFPSNGDLPSRSLFPSRGINRRKFAWRKESPGTGSSGDDINPWTFNVLNFLKV